MFNICRHIQKEESATLSFTNIFVTWKPINKPGQKDNHIESIFVIDINILLS